MLFALALIIYFVTIADPANFGLPNLYHGRDLNRAFDLYFNHKMIWHGPELTGGGQLPGPFYYFLLGLPLWLFGSYVAVLIFQFGLAALAAALIWKFAARHSPAGGLFAYFYFLGSPFIFSLILISWNPSFLPLFSILTIILFSQLQNSRALFWGGVILGLSLQIHLLQLVFLGGIFAALCFDNSPLRSRLKRIGYVVAGLILPLLPYFSYRLFSVSTHITDTSMSAGFESLTARAFLGEAKLETLSQVLLSRGDDILIVPAILLCFFSFGFAFRNYRFLLFSLLLSLIPALMVVRSIHLARYLYPFALLVGIVAAVAAPPLIQKHKKACFIFVAAAFATIFGIRFINNPYLPTGISLSILQKYLPALVAASFAVVLVLKERALRLIFFALIFLTFANDIHIGEVVRINTSKIPKVSGHIKLAEGEELLREIVSTSGWNYEQFRERTFMQGAGRVEDYSFFYRFISHNLPPTNAVRFDGLLIKSVLPTPTLVPAALETLFSKGDASCVKETSVENFHLCYYKFAHAASAVRINNIGYGYDFSQPAIAEIAAPQGVQVFSADHAVFYFNNCENFDPTCSVFFRTRLNGKRLHVEVLGDPVGAPMTSVNPSYAASIEKPALAVTCGAKESIYEIAPRIGYEKSKSTVLAPFDAVIEIQCARPSQIVLSVRKYSTAVRDAVFGLGIPFDLVWNPR